MVKKKIPEEEYASVIEAEGHYNTIMCSAFLFAIVLTLSILIYSLISAHLSRISNCQPSQFFQKCPEVLVPVVCPLALGLTPKHTDVEYLSGPCFMLNRTSLS